MQFPNNVLDLAAVKQDVKPNKQDKVLINDDEEMDSQSSDSQDSDVVDAANDAKQSQTDC